MWMEGRIAPVSLRGGPSMVPKSGGPVGADRVKVAIATTSEWRVVNVWWEITSVTRTWMLENLAVDGPRRIRASRHATKMYRQSRSTGDAHEQRCRAGAIVGRSVGDGCWW